MTSPDLLLCLAAAFLMFLGVLGCIIPGLPGTPFCWLSILAAKFITFSHLSWNVVIISGVVCVIVEVVNNFLPSYFSKISGGSKAGAWGAFIGTFVGLLTGNIGGILLGPFFGALAGEMIHDASDFSRAVKSASYSFLGFITGTGLRLITALIFLVVLVKSFLN